MYLPNENGLDLPRTTVCLPFHVSCMQIQYSIRHCSGVGGPQYLSQLQTPFLRKDQRNRNIQL